MAGFWQTPWIPLFFQYLVSRIFCRMIKSFKNIGPSQIKFFALISFHVRMFFSVYKFKQKSSIIHFDIPKHYPLANSFAKWKMLGAGRHPGGENKYIFYSRLSASLNIPNSPICEIRLYFKFNATNRMSGENLWAEIFGPKVGKVCYF